MKSPNISAGRRNKVGSGWTGGANSVVNPWTLPPHQYKWGVNVTCRGGVVQTRNGFKMRLSLPAGNFQGGIVFNSNKIFQPQSTITNLSGVVINTPEQVFTPQGTGSTSVYLSYALFCVDGNVYYAPFPLTQPADWNEYKLTNIKLDPNVNMVNFVIGTQSAQTDSSNNVTITPSHNIVIIQDRISQPAYWDGSNTTGAQSSVMPIGYWMAYSGNRLWVANGNIVSASDLGNPLSWLERTQGGGRGDFDIGGVVTGMADYIGQNAATALYVFTDYSTITLKSGILDRATWGATPNFQSVLYPSLGCVSGNSIAFQAGLMWWYSQGGLVAADIAKTSNLSSQVLYKDVEMAKVKRLLSSDLSGICAASFENYLMYSVPYLEPVNSETMVLDYSVASELSDGKPPAWCGVWNGIRPIMWSSDIVENENRLFAFSIDYAPTNDGSFNHLWEAFMPERYDTYLQINQDGSTTDFVNRIYCQMETALMGDEMDYKQMAFGEIDCSQIAGTTDVKVSYRGTRGYYQTILSTRLLAVNDPYQYSTSPNAAEIENLGFLQTQYRRLTTENVSRTSKIASCESKYTMDVDKAFSFLIEWCGQLGVDAIRMYMDEWQEKSVGSPSSNETQSCVVGENGSSIVVTLASPPQESSGNIVNTWNSTQTATITLAASGTSPSVSATATASYTSYISPADAQSNALTLARQEATNAANQYRKANP